MLGEEYNNLEVNTYFLDFQIEWSKSVVDMNKYGSRAGYVDVGLNKRVADNYIKSICNYIKTM